MARQVRCLLADLDTLGVDELAVPDLPPQLPPCPPDVKGVDMGGDALCRQATLGDIRAELEECRRCPLCKGRKNVVFGAGNPRARLVLVGEPPGREEDETGGPFAGEAGRLLDRMLFAMGMERSEVYLCNAVKCRPSGDREPKADEIAACEPYLQRQLAAIGPRLIIAFGAVAAQSLLRDRSPLEQLRGQWREYGGIPLMPTYHPAYLLRTPTAKREVWEDLKQVMARLRKEREPGP
ncbi:uracil-DNA glycosylase [Desulfuromonas sp.]|uniref:uracil-DNA glycosylase n=1 Tax=Desulfuromonas sp. TaxID=892 RepID=UPI0025C3F92A|nr:uracil-DNA glycosylase [Desulfuromonas sp.]